VVLSIREATLEILDPAHAAFVDRIETGKRTSVQVHPGQVRFAFEVANLQDAMATASAAGVSLVSGPVETPWKDLNARVAGPDGLQVTLFQTPP
jgi:hypothetical protein